MHVMLQHNDFRRDIDLWLSQQAKESSNERVNALKAQVEQLRKDLQAKDVELLEKIEKLKTAEEVVIVERDTKVDELDTKFKEAEAQTKQTEQQVLFRFSISVF